MVNLDKIATEGFSTVFEPDLNTEQHIKNHIKSKQWKRVNFRCFYHIIEIGMETRLPPLFAWETWQNFGETLFLVMYNMCLTIWEMFYYLYFKKEIIGGFCYRERRGWACACASEILYTERSCCK